LRPGYKENYYMETHLKSFSIVVLLMGCPFILLATTIDFDDVGDGTRINTNYALQGVTFSCSGVPSCDVYAVDVPDGYTPSCCNDISATRSWLFNTSGGVVRATFSVTVTSVSIQAISFQINEFGGLDYGYLSAFAATGNPLQTVHNSAYGAWETLSITATGPIAWVEFSCKDLKVQSAFDNLSFKPCPLPKKSVLDLSTGFDNQAGSTISNGLPDDNYELSWPVNFVGLTEVCATVVPDNAYPIGPWAASTPGSKWIGTPALASDAPGGVHTFKIIVEVPSSLRAADLSIAGKWSSDDATVDIIVNGVSTGITNTGNSTTLSPFPPGAGLGLFHSGDNTVEFLVKNERLPQRGTYPIGLRVEARLTCQLPSSTLGLWLATGSMTVPRVGHTMTLLQNGEVLVAGGDELATAELYDPATGRFRSIGRMTEERKFHTATLLPDGKVLIAGGELGSLPFSTAELYDPATVAFTHIGRMIVGRRGHVAVLLDTQEVLITGGSDGTLLLNDSELYNPGSKTFRRSGPLVYVADTHTATLLPGGRALIVSTDTPGDMEIQFYDTAHNSFFSPLRVVGGAISNHTATLLPLAQSSKVLIVGGAFARGQVYDPVSGSLTTISPTTGPRRRHVAALLPSGKVLLAGGEDTGGPLGTAELFDPVTATFSATGTMIRARTGAGIALLQGGTVLVAGGEGPNGALASAELYNKTSTCATPIPVFRRGDANDDLAVDISDPVKTFGFLFLGNSAPLSCLDAADSNDDGRVDISDGIFTLSRLFSGGPPLPPPGSRVCGPDPTEDELPECTYDGC
jgi:hypothetical protein